jgi:NAD(P)-dependent dehydrogenase (short-subunit alcohol dehydrogenase family)
MQVDLDSQVAFISGSTIGIGGAIALEMARNGADIAINGKSEESAPEILENIEQLVKN